MNYSLLCKIIVNYFVKEQLSQIVLIVLFIWFCSVSYETTVMENFKKYVCQF